MKQVISILWA